MPLLLAGRDVLGLAQTGSGKTLAYVLPMVRHCIDQREIGAGEGPIAIVLAPTRELAVQILGEVKKFTSVLGMKAVVLGGGASKWEQSRALRAGCEVIIATPGRLIDQIRDGATNLRRVTFLVLDEADRMLEMGFSKQVYSITSAARACRVRAIRNDCIAHADTTCMRVVQATFARTDKQPCCPPRLSHVWRRSPLLRCAAL